MLECCVQIKTCCAQPTAEAAHQHTTSHLLCVCRYTCSLAFFQEQVQVVWSRYHKPIWVTEFNCPNFGGSVDQQVCIA